MPKLFCISDVHGFYNEMIEALNKAGFDPNNEDHWLISCGDTLDRGRQPREVMNCLMSLPRKILVKGNHEALMMNCLAREFPYGNDWSNGTAQSIVDLAPSANTFDEACAAIYPKISKFIDGMVNYFETKNYIFVHSFVPLNCYDHLPAYYRQGKQYSKMENWREAHQHQWDDAMWGNPYKLAAQGLLPDKTLVFGHFHTSWPRYYYEGKQEWGPDADFSPYYGDGYIGIDACTAYSGKVNVLVLEDEFLTVQN